MSARTITLGAVFAVAIAGPALAAMTPQQQADFKKTCTGDYMRLCADNPPDSPQTQQCFRQNMKQLSARCRSTISTFQRGG